MLLLVRMRYHQPTKDYRSITLHGGVSAVITDLGILEPDSETCELTLTQVHPGIGVDQVKESTSWPLRIAPALSVGSPPTAVELAALRALTDA